MVRASRAAFSHLQVHYSRWLSYVNNLRFIAVLVFLIYLQRVERDHALCASYFLTLCPCIALVAGQVNLLNFVTGGIGDVLGSSFGVPGTNASYDYVVVGGGNAGLTLATRLAEDPSITVAVVEAGGFYEVDNGNRSVVPGYANFYTGSDPDNYQPLIDWGFSTVPQPVCIRIACSLLYTKSDWTLLPRRPQVIVPYTTREVRHWAALLLEIT